MLGGSNPPNDTNESEGQVQFLIARLGDLAKV